MTRQKRRSDDPRNCATAWFSELERARNNKDERREAEVLRQLHRLGVEVTFTGRSVLARKGAE